MKKFFQTIYGESQGNISLNSKSEDGSLSSQRWFNYPKHLDTMVAYSEMRSIEDLYCSVALFSGERRTKEDPYAVARVVYADADTCNPGNFRLEPSIIVQTSPGRWHCWWVLDQEVSASTASRLSKIVWTAHKDQGCDAGWITSKLLRVPGSLNTKNYEDFEVKAEYTEKVYTEDDFLEIYKDIQIDNYEESDLGGVPTPVSPERLHEIEKLIEENGLTELYLERPKHGQSWSERAFRLEIELFQLGCSPRDVFSAMLESPANKYNPENAGLETQQGVKIPRRRDPQGTLWTEVKKAYAEFQEMLSLGVVEEELLPKSDEEVEKKFSFLTMEQYKFVKDNPTWVDDYVDWAKNLSPDSATVYHQSLGYSLLSSAFGDRVRVRNRYSGPRGFIPNIWTLVLGDTTRTRKSTAAAYFGRMLESIENNDGTLLDIGSKTTPEGVIKILAERDGMVSVLNTDEINGFFEEMTSKKHLSGAKETYTDLYGGTVPVVRTASKDTGNSVRATTCFNIVGVGIRRRTARILTKGDFETGFLARFCWAVADPPPYSRGMGDYHVGTEDVLEQYDKQFQDLSIRLLRARDMYDPGAPTLMSMSEEAVEILNDFRHEMQMFIIRMGDDGTLEASVERLRDTVVRAATLLAAFEGVPDVQVRHLLHAIKQGELWFNDMLRMYNEISSSLFGARLDEVELFIAGGAERKRTEAQIYNKFALRPSEFKEITDVLQMQGRIRLIPGSPKRWESL